MTKLESRGLNNLQSAKAARMRKVRSRIAITLTVVAVTWTTSSQVQRSIASDAPRTQHGPPLSDVTAHATRQRFLEMFARAYFSGRTGQLLIVPREGDFITRADVAYMHGSPWTYDVAIPLMFAGPMVITGTYSTPATQQDVAPTLAAALGIQMPPTTTGRVLQVLRTGSARPRVVMLLVLDGMRRDYFDRYAASMPTLTALRQRSAWFTQAQVNFLPTNTAAGHSTISTGADPRMHGITGVSVYERTQRRRHDFFAGGTPQDLMALTLADVWQLETSGRAIILTQGSIGRAATPLAGHGACQLNGAPVVLASYDQDTGNWTSNPNCFRLPAYLKDRNAKTLWSASDKWMGHKIDSTEAVRYSALFPKFEADAMAAMMEREPLGEDNVPDLILLNYKAADFVGHKYGPDSDEMRITLGEMDAQLKRLLSALEAKVGKDYLLALTADHGMPPEPSSPDRRHLASSIVDRLHEKFDPEAKQLITSFEPENGQIFVDEDRLSSLGLTLRDLARFLESQPFLFAVFTNEDVRQAATAMKPPVPTPRLAKRK
ncbi:MAG TPA: alkaline phosphatase family protein [Terriglobales bacterium]|nr:alkaline phosphatase family protein [Terriglobales bacterium]